MKIVFCSNYLNHHQLPFSLEMTHFSGVEYHFVATSRMGLNRAEMGYREMNDLYPWVIKAYEGEKEQTQAIELINEADVVIIGSAPDLYIKERLRKNKLTFKYSERLYKKGIWRRFKPRSIVGQYIHHTRYRNKNVYMLCASAYTSYDFSLWGNYKGKCYKWGYFPMVEKKEFSSLQQNKNGKETEILWAGRMLKLKHPEYVLHAAEYLKKQGRNFHITVIGEGEMRKELESAAEKMMIKDNLGFLDFMPSERVRSYMEKADIFLFTSDFNEGWGAVLNEAMGSACAVVASHACGSVPFLLNDCENGMIYTYGNVREFCQKVDRLVTDIKFRKQLQLNAYRTIFEEWSAPNAAEQFVKLAASLLNGEKIYRKNGVCSAAEIIKNNWKR